MKWTVKTLRILSQPEDPAGGSDFHKNFGDRRKVVRARGLAIEKRQSREFDIWMRRSLKTR